MCDILLSFDWLCNDENYLYKNDQNHSFCQKYCTSAPLTVCMHVCTYLRRIRTLISIISSLGCRVFFSCYDVYVAWCFYGHRIMYQHRTVDTEGSASAPPRVEVVSGLYGKITPTRAGGSATMVERLQSWQRGGGIRTNTLGALAVVEQTKHGDPLQLSTGAQRTYTLKKTKQFRFRRPHAH